MDEAPKMNQRWPHNKQFAFSLCFDIDGSTIWKLRAADFPNGKKYIRSISMGDYGPNQGVHNILTVLAQFGVKATFFVPAVIARDNPELMHDILAQGHEIAHHGYAHEYDYGETVAEQIALINHCQDIFQDVIERKAIGFRPTGGLLPGTVHELAHDPNNLYLISEKGAETPYYKYAGTAKTSLIELPARIEFDDYYQLSYNYFPPQPESQDRIAPYEDVIDNFKAEVAGAHEFGAHCITAFHPQVSGTPGKLLILKQLIQYITSFDDVWVAPCCDVAKFWQEQHYALEVKYDTTN